MRWIATFLVLFSFHVNATLIEADWKEPEDGLITIAGPYQWLDLSVTNGLSVLDIFSQMYVGGYFESWHFARSHQIIDLFLRAGAVAPSVGFQDDEWEFNGNAARKLITYWAGDVRRFGSNLDLTPGREFIEIGGIIVDEAEAVLWAQSADCGLFDEFCLFPKIVTEHFVTMALVRKNDVLVPNPASIGLFAMGLFCLMWRKNNQID